MITVPFFRVKDFYIYGTSHSSNNSSTSSFSSNITIKTFGNDSNDANYSTNKIVMLTSGRFYLRVMFDGVGTQSSTLAGGAGTVKSCSFSLRLGSTKLSEYAKSYNSSTGLAVVSNNWQFSGGTAPDLVASGGSAASNFTFNTKMFYSSELDLSIGDEIFLNVSGSTNNASFPVSSNIAISNLSLSLDRLT